MTRRILIWILVALAALLSTVLLLLVWGLGTGSGTRALWGIVTEAVDGLEVDSVEGRLAGPMAIRGLRYADAYRELEIGSLSVDWHPRRLFAGELLLEGLHVADVDYLQVMPSPPPEEEAPFAVPESFSLPVDLDVRDITLENLAYRASPEAEPLVIARVELAATYRGFQLAVPELSVRAPLFTVEAGASAITRNDYPADLTVNWEARLPDLAPLSGELSLAGDLAAMQIRHTVAPPLDLEQTATIRDITSSLAFSTETVIRRVRLAEIGETLPDLAVTGRLSAQGTPRDLRFLGDLGIDSVAAGVVELSTRGGFRDQVLALDGLTLTGGDAAVMASSGRLDLNGDVPEFDLQSRWQALQWPLAEQPPQVNSPRGELSVAGTSADYRVALDAQLEVPGQTGGELQVSGRGSSEFIDLARLHLALLDGNLDGSARVAWTPEVTGSVELNGSGLDPSVLLPELPGDLRLELRAGGGMTDGSARARIDAFSISGRFRDQPLDLQLRGSLEGSRLQLDTLELAAASTRLSAAGRVGEKLGLDWTLSSPDLGELLPESGGVVEGEGRIEGTLDVPAVHGFLRARNLTHRQYSLARLSLDMDIDLERPTPSALDLALDGARLGEVAVESLTLVGRGTRSDHRLQLAAETSVGSADLDLAGELEDASWLVRLTGGRLQYDELGAWTLETPHLGRISREQQQLDSGCWASDGARLCVEGMRTAESVSAAVTLDALALGYFRPLLPPAIALAGQFGASLDLRGQGAAPPDIVARLDMEGVELRSGEGTSQPGQLLLALEPSSANLDYGDDGLAADLALPLTGGGGISASARVGQGEPPLNERPLVGRLDVDLRDIGFLAALSPEIERAAGMLRGGVDVGGSLADPAPDAELNVTGGTLQLASPGVEITGLTLAAHNVGQDALAFEGSARSGGGQLALSGSAQLTGGAMRADVSLLGERFQVFDTPDARVAVSPDLAIAVHDSGVRVTGEVRVPHAEITPKKLPPAAVSASGDQVIIEEGGDAASSTAERTVEANVRITLGDEVTVDGFGFKGRLTGGLVVEQTPGRPTIGTGTLNILDGEYRAYGQGLVIEEGKILFAGGPLDKPGINVRAVRRPADGILVGVRVRGAVQQPDVELFSEPGMSQTEQLSWLVLGRPLKGTSEGEGDMLAQAATMLSLKGGNYLMDRFGGDVGVDTMGFETGSGEAGAASDVNQAAFVIGKYLSPDLYVSYGLGLFEPVSTVRLEYTLDENWKLSTESSTFSSGGDIIYTIER
ncbi:MAG: translocation/assembly module TamB domain-containing protein [Halioglobus sp.]